MRLRLILPLLVAVSGCFLLNDEPPDEPLEGAGGIPASDCTRDLARDCEGRRCGELSTCDEPCRVDCLTWHALPPSDATVPADEPPHVHMAAARCDEARGVLWLFGGDDVVEIGLAPCSDRSTLVVPTGDLWQVRREEEHAVWTRVEVQGEARPSPRAGALLLLGPGGSLWLFGGVHITEDELGCETRHELLGDLWRFDGAVWELQPDSVGRPPPRAFVLQADDPTTGRVQLVGGAAAIDSVTRSTPARDAWDWDPASGTFERVPGDVFDPTLEDGRVPLFTGAGGWAGPSRGRVYFGGRLGDPNLQAGRVYDTTTWQHPPDGGLLSRLERVWLPGPRELIGAASVPGLGVIAYDGYLDSKNEAFRDEQRDRTWLLGDEGDWQELPFGARDPARSHPDERSAYAMTFCAALGGPVLFGGDLGNRPSNQLFVLEP